MTTYNWDLIERLLHEVQNGAGKPFAPRIHAEELAHEQQQAGDAVGSLDALKALAAHYEAQLLHDGFIAPRPEEEGGNGENFVLTARGLQLLSMIDSAIPGESHPRELLNAKGDSALQPEVFDEIARTANVA